MYQTTQKELFDPAVVVALSADRAGSDPTAQGGKIHAIVDNAQSEKPWRLRASSISGPRHVPHRMWRYC